jgi:hypothetical protein
VHPRFTPPLQPQQEANDSEFDWRREHLDKDEREHLDNMRALEVELEVAFARGDKTATLKLSTLGWLSIVAEIKDRRPRNYSRWLADDTLARLNEAIERLHEVAVFMIACGSSVPMNGRLSG